VGRTEVRGGPRCKRRPWGILTASTTKSWKCLKGKRKAPPKVGGRTKPQPKEMADDGDFEDGAAEDTTGTSRNAKDKVKVKARSKRKSAISGKSRVAD
jgi:hypothetical protein